MFQTPLHSYAEPNSLRFDFGVTPDDSDGVLASDLIREGHGNQFALRKYASEFTNSVQIEKL